MTAPNIAAKVAAVCTSGRSQSPPLKRRKLDSVQFTSTVGHAGGSAPDSSCSRSRSRSTTPIASRRTRSQAKTSSLPLHGEPSDARRISRMQQTSRHKSPNLNESPATHVSLIPQSTTNAATLEIKTELEEPSIPPVPQGSVLVTCGVYRVTPVPKDRNPSVRRAWIMDTFKEFQRRVQMLEIPVEIDSQKLLYVSVFNVQCHSSAYMQLRWPGHQLVDADPSHGRCRWLPTSSDQTLGFTFLRPFSSASFSS